MNDENTEEMSADSIVKDVIAAVFADSDGATTTHDRVLPVIERALRAARGAVRLKEHGLVVAGEGAEGYGVITGFHGEGPLVHARVCELGHRSGIPLEWMPDSKEPKVQLTRAVQKVAAEMGLDAKQEKRKNRQVAEVREPSSRWLLVSGGAVGAVKAGDKFGDVALVATLYDDVEGQQIEFDPPDSPLAVAVAKEYDRLRGAEVMTASDVTGWLNGVHRYHMGAIRYGGSWYVPVEHRALAESIVEVFWNEARWGSDWWDPPMPAMTCAQLSRGLANGICDEVAATMKMLEGQRRKIRVDRGGYDKAGKQVDGGEYDEAGELVDVGQRAAENFMVRFVRIRRRIEKNAHLIGGEHVVNCQRTVDDAMIELDRCLEGGVTNTDGSFRDLEAEAAAAEAKANEHSFAGVA